MNASLQAVREDVRAYQDGDPVQSQLFRRITGAILAHGIEAVFAELPADITQEYHQWVDKAYRHLLYAPPGTPFFIGSNITQREIDERFRQIREVEPIVRAWFESHGG
jgi:hypothetical protein